MNDKELELIYEILRKYDADQNDMLQVNPTVFEILDRTYDEDLISRMLVYVLKRDEQIICKILSLCCKREIPPCRITKIECEKSMCGGRADVFAEAEDIDGKRYALTVENKIYSYEHDDQTETYYKFVNAQSQYRDYEKAFVYLKPDFNISQPVCENFTVLTYNSLLSMIGMTDDVIINDFVRHIKSNLISKEVKLMDAEALVLQNYVKLKEIINNAESKFEEVKRQIIVDLFSNNRIEGLDYNPYKKYDEQREGFPAEKLVIERANTESCFRIYRKDKWYARDVDIKEKYYFFVELKFESNDPNNVLVLKIIKRYGQKSQESIIHQFLSDSKLQYEGVTWSVLSVKPINLTEFTVLSDEWKEALIERASKIIEEDIDEMDEIFAQFEKWKETKNT